MHLIREQLIRSIEKSPTVTTTSLFTVYRTSSTMV